MTPMLVLIRLKERLTGSTDKRYEDTPDGPRLRAEAPREENDAIREDLLDRGAGRVLTPPRGLVPTRPAMAQTFWSKSPPAAGSR
jgi:hypothetical protein